MTDGHKFLVIDWSQWHMAISSENIGASEMSLTSKWHFLKVHITTGSQWNLSLTGQWNFWTNCFKNCHRQVNDSFEAAHSKCHWLVNDNFEAPILSELMAICHWLQSMTPNLWTSVIDCSQWQKFMAKPAKKCHWPRSMTKKSVIDWMYTIYG